MNTCDHTMDQQSIHRMCLSLGPITHFPQFFQDSHHPQCVKLAILKKGTDMCLAGERI